ncbi:MAG: hypothetical protein J6U98_00155 [Abditibacteriota bacterium]|nr:hypothetical protein [Abditibacteriota bacterium]
MRKMFFVLALIVMVAACAFASDTVNWLDLYPGTNTAVADVDGGAYTYYPDPEDFGISFNMTAVSNWLVNANTGDELTVTYDVVGITPDGLSFSAALAEVNASSDYQAGYGKTLTIGSPTITDGTYTFTTVLDSPIDVLQSLNVYSFYMYMPYPGSEVDGSVTYDGLPAFFVTNPKIFVNGEEVESETLIPEPATYAYGVMGLVSVFGLKRRIRK